MKIIDLHDKDADFTSAGGKAAGLNRLAINGFRIPRGFVILDLDNDADLNEAAKFYINSGLGEVAVRSSASNEDGNDFSSAGQYSTVLNVNGEQGFKDAVTACIDSLASDTAKSYSSFFMQAHSAKMNIVVQQMLKPKSAGVCFTKSPSDENVILVEAVEGLGEALVSGTASAQQYVAPRLEMMSDKASDTAKALCANGTLNATALQEMCADALRAEQIFDIPLDMEWAIGQDDALYWLQARAITATDDYTLDELDPKYNMDDMVITRCNIGEMLPGAVTPLTISVTLYAIDYGMREMMRTAGTYKTVNDIPEYSCALSSSNHLFINLSAIYEMEGVVLGVKSDSIDLSLCGRLLHLAEKKPKRVGFFKRLNNGRKYFAFILSRKKAMRQLADMAFKLKIGENASSPEELYRAIDSEKWQNDRAMTLHYVTSSHSGAMSSALFMILKTRIDDDEKSKSIIAEMLENIDGIESVDILRSLRVLASAILAKNPDAASFSTGQLSEYLKTADEEVSLAHRAFIEKHGHRTIREAEIRNKGWSDDESAFLEYLKTVISGGEKEAVKDNSVPNLKAIVKKHGFKGFKKSMLVYLAKQARQGVINREYSKSKIISVLDVFKKSYARLAEMLVEKGALPDADLIYFLTHAEIGELIFEKKYALIKKAIKRRRAHAEQSQLVFEEVSVGKPLAISIPENEAVSGSQIQGTPISRGITTGKARIVKSLEDARELQKGEIMVASYTDIGWSPYYCLISGLVTEVGSVLSHGAVVAREYALPLISNVAGATRIIKTGDTITLNGTTGTITVH